MEDGMQDKLEQYRLRKRRKQKFDEIKRKFRSFWLLGTGMEDTNRKTETKIQIGRTSDADAEDEDLELSTDDEQKYLESHPNPDAVIPSEELQKENKIFKYTLWSVYFLFWVTLYIIAIELKFGLVFLMLSALFGIYFNTRTGPKNHNEISAYSVFNKNCKSIDGTLTAEQFEREMRYGAGSVK